MGAPCLRGVSQTPSERFFRDILTFAKMPGWAISWLWRDELEYLARFWI